MTRNRLEKKKFFGISLLFISVLFLSISLSKAQTVYFSDTWNLGKTFQWEITDYEDNDNNVDIKKGDIIEIEIIKTVDELNISGADSVDFIDELVECPGYYWSGEFPYQEKLNGESLTEDQSFALFFQFEEFFGLLDLDPNRLAIIRVEPLFIFPEYVSGTTETLEYSTILFDYLSELSSNSELDGELKVKFKNDILEVSYDEEGSTWFLSYFWQVDFSENLLDIFEFQYDDEGNKNDRELEFVRMGLKKVSIGYFSFVTSSCALGFIIRRRRNSKKGERRT